MTTAHRPTFDAARGGTGRGENDLTKMTKQYSSKDMPSHTRIKSRQSGQTSLDDLRGKEFRRDLEDKERTAARDKRSQREQANTSSTKKPRIEGNVGSVDADDPLDDEDSDVDSDEDDTQELMAELDRIKKERAQDKAQLDAAKQMEEEKIRTDNILHGNPLLGGGKSDFKVARRWDDDVVFKNCAKGIQERIQDQTFINDSIRSEFHKKFMERYVK